MEKYLSIKVFTYFVRDDHVSNLRVSARPSGGVAGSIGITAKAEPTAVPLRAAEYQQSPFNTVSCVKISIIRVMHQPVRLQRLIVNLKFHNNKSIGTWGMALGVCSRRRLEQSIVQCVSARASTFTALLVNGRLLSLVGWILRQGRPQGRRCRHLFYSHRHHHAPSL